MLQYQPSPPIRTEEKWLELFTPQHGHILWDGNSPDPCNPIHAYRQSWEFVKYAKGLGFFGEGHFILDLGCGNGRFGIPFSEMDVSYLGIDPVKESIDFCNKIFVPYAHLRFRYADIYNECFNKEGSIDPAKYVIPAADEHFDDVICFSVFTHLQAFDVAQHYMAEIKRVLKRGGKLYCSWYRSPPNPAADVFVGRTVYLESDILNMLQGFSCQFSYGGHTAEYYDQWGLFCTKL